MVVKNSQDLKLLLFAWQDKCLVYVIIKEGGAKTCHLQFCQKFRLYYFVLQVIMALWFLWKEFCCQELQIVFVKERVNSLNF